ncbi:LysR family transcriptional regulator [Trinickia acidisoli]|uniref:LysR family transcriptional regulator n=1 Tax=Trinickia acidisoli TaxID=2767482 RepID=UPI001A8E0122|nr:LysR family transcriptional regulator [Trinickia acidisoli]
MATPLVRLAPLDLIRGFVAVGRRMSVTLAAEDLCLTQSAVSRQIHSLEDALGVSLFHRGYRSITFTQAGERLFRTADGVVRQLQDVFEAITRPAERQPVTVTASIGVATLWLLPRLPELQRRYPALDVRVAANDKLLDLHTEGIDLAIRYASIANPPSGATRLFDETIVPVASPSLGVTGVDTEGKLVALGSGKGRANGHAYWLVQADAAARQDVHDVARWIAEQARTSGGEAVTVAGHAARPATPPENVLMIHSAKQPEGYAGGGALAVEAAGATGERVALS